MVDAIFGLLGVLIGGAISTGTQLWLEGQRRRAILRRATRLVSNEMLHASAALTILADDDATHRLTTDVLDDLLPTSAWQAHMPDLAEGLRDPLWSNVMAAYNVIGVYRTLMDPRLQPAQTASLRESMGQWGASMRDTALLLAQNRGRRVRKKRSRRDAVAAADGDDGVTGPSEPCLGRRQ